MEGRGGAVNSYLVHICSRCILVDMYKRAFRAQSRKSSGHAQGTGLLHRDSVIQKIEKYETQSHAYW